MVLRKHMFYFNLKCANMFTLSKCKHSLTIIYLMGEFFLNVRPPPLKCRRLLAHVRQLASEFKRELFSSASRTKALGFKFLGYIM